MNETIAADGRVITYRGGSIEELLPQIRGELGRDAVIVRQREGLIGGVGGFFQKRCVEVEARPGGPGIDVYDDGGVTEPEPHPPAFEEPEDDLKPGPEPLVRNDVATREGLATPAVQELVGQAQPFAEMLEMADPEPSMEIEPKPSIEIEIEPKPSIEIEIEPKPSLEIEPEPEPEPKEPLGPPRAEVLRQGMTAAGLGEDIAREVVDSVLASAMPFVNAGRLRTLVRNQLALRIPIALAAEPGPRTIALVGPAGAGKTAAIAAIAAAHAAQGAPAACLALNSSDDGAALEAILAGTAVRVLALNTSQLAATPLSNRDGGLLLIDTPPLWSGAEQLGKIARRIATAKPAEVHLVMRAGAAAAAGAELLEGLAALRPNRLLLTGAAETAHLGGVLDVAIRSGIPLGYVAESPQEVALADPRDLAGRIVP